MHRLPLLLPHGPQHVCRGYVCSKATFIWVGMKTWKMNYQFAIASLNSAKLWCLSEPRAIAERSRRYYVLMVACSSISEHDLYTTRRCLSRCVIPSFMEMVACLFWCHCHHIGRILDKQATLHQKWKTRFPEQWTWYCANLYNRLPVLSGCSIISHLARRWCSTLEWN